MPKRLLNQRELDDIEDRCANAAILAEPEERSPINFDEARWLLADLRHERKDVERLAAVLKELIDWLDDWDQRLPVRLARIVERAEVVRTDVRPASTENK